MALGDEFNGLPMESLIGAPLQAACAANVRLAQATAQFIQSVGFCEKPKLGADGKQVLDPNGAPLSTSEIRQAVFKYDVPTETGKDTYSISAPLLAIVPIPCLRVTKVDITFDMEVKSSEKEEEGSSSQGSLEANATVGWGLFKATVKVSGSIAAHKEHTRTTDKSAKYHVEVCAEDSGITEGLARILDMMNQCVVPVKSPPAAVQKAKDAAGAAAEG